MGRGRLKAAARLVTPLQLPIPLLPFTGALYIPRRFHPRREPCNPQVPAHPPPTPHPPPHPASHPTSTTSITIPSPSPPFAPTGTSTPPSAVPPTGIPATFACARAWTLRSHALPQSPHARPSPCYPTPPPPQPVTHPSPLTPSPQLDWHHANLRPAAAGTFQQAFLWPLLGLPVSDVLKEQNAKNLHLCLKDLDAALAGDEPARTRARARVRA